VTKAKPITLPLLPWADNALEPFISKNTISFHYGKHHQTYVDKLHELIAGKPEADMPLEDIVRSTVGDPQNRRKDYVVSVIDSLLNWEFVTQNRSRESDQRGAADRNNPV
jgi:superoxide dismutase